MDTRLLSADKDPMGQAILDYHQKGKAARLRVFSSLFEEDEIPVKTLFRSFGEMPAIEQEALRLARGKILDAGAGSGCHSLALKEMGKTSMAIDISPLSTRVMRERGLNAQQANLLDPSWSDSFDTILMLMNGSGIIGRIENLNPFFQRMKNLLNPGGCILMDSSDLRYLFEDEAGDFLPDPEAGYYGEIDFRMKYKQVESDPFDWLYIDFDTLALHAAQAGFHAERILEGEHFDYLARLTMA